MATRRTVSVELDAGTVSLAELAAERDGMTVADWIARAARRGIAAMPLSPNYVPETEAEMLAEDADQAVDDAAIEADEAKRFRAAG